MVKSLLHRSEHLINEDRERPTGTRSWWWESLRPGWCLRPFSNRDRGYNLPCIRPSVMMWPKDQRTIEPSPWQLSILYPDVLQLKVLGGKSQKMNLELNVYFVKNPKWSPEGVTLCVSWQPDSCWELKQSCMRWCQSIFRVQQEESFVSKQSAGWRVEPEISVCGKIIIE